LREMLDDPAERARFAKAGVERAEEFSLDRLADQFLPIYEAAIRGPRTGSATARPVRLTR
jgi:glycosyltransferase involved in cell wall biosynthesis